jgi:hypothetical protein
MQPGCQPIAEQVEGGDDLGLGHRRVDTLEPIDDPLDDEDRVSDLWRERLRWAVMARTSA